MKTRAFAFLALILPTVLLAQTARYPLTSAAGLSPHNVVVEPATLQGKKGLKVLASQTSVPSGTTIETLVLIDAQEFGNGVIEAEIAGDVRPGAPEGARGFVRANTNPMSTSFPDPGRRCGSKCRETRRACTCTT